MQTRKWLSAAALLLLGIYMLETLITGEIAFYIAAQFNWLAVMAGVIFLAMGAVRVSGLLAESRAEAAHPAHDHDHDHDHEHHDHDHGHTHSVSWLVLAVIAVPLALGILLPAKPLTASAIGTSGIAMSLAASNGKVATFSVSPEQRNVLDWVRAFSAAGSPDEFIGQPADVLGFVYRDVRFDENQQFMLARFTMSCCVADAVAIGVIAESEQAATLSQDTWLRVKGRFAVRDFDGQPTPVLVVESLETVPMPDRPYLYP